MILIENLIVRDTFKNIRENLRLLRIQVYIYPKYTKMYKNLEVRFSQLVGEAMWLQGNSYEYEKAVVNRILDLDTDLKKTLLKLYLERDSNKN